MTARSGKGNSGQEILNERYSQHCIPFGRADHTLLKVVAPMDIITGQSTANFSKLGLRMHLLL